MRSLETIQQEVENVIESSQEYPFHVDATKIISEWYKAKLPYITKFNGETALTLFKSIQLELSPTQRDKEYHKFMSALYKKHLVPHEAKSGLSFETFMNENKLSFFENTVSIPHYDLKISKGMKLSKAFRYFFAAGEVRRAQDLASQYMQLSKITGDLVLSVDPLDYLTLSENNYHWRSCQALDGDYRAGNISYMLDDTTLIAYLVSTAPTQLRSFPEGMLWNNKRWRMLLHTNNFETVCWYNRPYPFESSKLRELVGKAVIALSADKLKEPFHIGFKTINFEEENEEFEMVVNHLLGSQDRIYDARDVIDNTEGLNFPDLCYSSSYTPWVSGLKRSVYRELAENSKYIEDWDDAFHNEFDITIGKKYQCLKCGRRYLDRPSSFLCKDCRVEEDLDEDAFLHCERCGRRLFGRKEEYWSDHILYCQKCYEKYIKEEEE